MSEFGPNLRAIGLPKGEGFLHTPFFRQMKCLARLLQRRIIDRFFGISICKDYSSFPRSRFSAVRPSNATLLPNLLLATLVTAIACYMGCRRIRFRNCKEFRIRLLVLFSWTATFATSHHC